jgi:hypothetical protein
VKYILRINALNPYPTLDITPEHFSELRSARNLLSAAFEMEELYDVLIATYRKLEELLVTTSVAHMVETRHQHQDFYTGRLDFNVAIVALLTSARLYIERIGSATQRATPETKLASDAVSAIRAKHYDSSPSYRFMEAFRNHVQHAGLPVGLTTFGSMRTKESDFQLMEHSVGLFISKAKLLQNDKFKAKAVDDLPEKINITESVRAYVEALSSVQVECREMAKYAISDARKLVEKAISHYLVIHSGSPVGLAAIAVEEQKYVEAVPLLLDWDDVRLRLQEKNPELRNLTKRYVSSQIRP